MTISKYRERRESLIEVAQTVTELEATMMLAVMRERFKWQGVIFTRSEVACEWLTQQDDDDHMHSDEDTDKVFELVSSSMSWKRLSRNLNILGWGLLDDAVAEARRSQDLKAENSDA